MDTSPCGSFNYAALDNLRKNVEHLKKGKQGIIPSSSAVKNCAYLLEAHGKQLGLGFVEAKMEMGCAYKCDFDAVLRLSIEMCGLTQCAIRANFPEDEEKNKPVIVSVTLDGTPLTDDYTLIVGGLKDVELRSIDPITGKPIEDWQSRNRTKVCFLMLARDCKEACDCPGPLKDFLDWAGRSCIVTPAGKQFGKDVPELDNIKVNSPQDMNSQWKTVGLGGATSTHFCLCCDCTQDEKALFVVGVLMCWVDS